MPTELATETQKLWQADTSPPVVFEFLGHQIGTDAAQQLAVLLEDQKHRWVTDSPLKVEDYLSKLPDLAADPRIKLELAVWEYQARQNGDTSPSIDEFTSRFGDISDTLRSKLSELSGDRGVSSTPTYAAETTSNRRIGRYRVVRLLGEGAFGRVWLAEDKELQRRRLVARRGWFRRAVFLRE